MIGDVMRYTISLGNTGQDTATNTILTDNIPAWTTYVPNTLEIISGPNAGHKTDAVNDLNDQAEYISSGTPHVVFRLGNGASGTAGGSVPFGTFTSMSFDVTVNADIPSGTILTNAAGTQIIASQQATHLGALGPGLRLGPVEVLHPVATGAVEPGGQP